MHTDSIGNTLLVGDKIHGSLWHKTHSNLFEVLGFSSPASEKRPRRKVQWAREIPDELMIRVNGGWVRFRAAYKVQDPSQHHIDQAEMDEFLHASCTLNAMQAAGVDNWDDGGVVAELMHENPCPCTACAEEREEDDLQGIGE